MGAASKLGRALISRSRVSKESPITKKALQALNEPKKKRQLAAAKGKATKAKKKARAQQLEADKARGKETLERIKKKRASSKKVSKISGKSVGKKLRKAIKAEKGSKRRYEFRSDPYGSGSPRKTARQVARKTRKTEIKLDGGNKKKAAQIRDASKAQKRRKIRQRYW